MCKRELLKKVVVLYWLFIGIWLEEVIRGFSGFRSAWFGEECCADAKVGDVELENSTASINESIAGLLGEDCRLGNGPTEEKVINQLSYESVNQSIKRRIYPVIYVEFPHSINQVSKHIRQWNFGRRLKCCNFGSVCCSSAYCGSSCSTANSTFPGLGFEILVKAIFRMTTHINQSIKLLKKYSPLIGRCTKLGEGKDSEKFALTGIRTPDLETWNLMWNWNCHSTL